MNTRFELLRTTITKNETALQCGSRTLWVEILFASLPDALYPNAIDSTKRIFRWLVAQEDYYYHYEFVLYVDAKKARWVDILIGFHYEAEAFIFRLEFPHCPVYREDDNEQRDDHAI